MNILKISLLFLILINLIFIYCSEPTRSNSEIEPLSLTIVPTAVSVYGGSDGSIDLQVSGGKIPYSFVWSNGQTTEDIGNLSAGTYNVTVTDEGSQKETASAIISPPGKIIFTLMSNGDYDGIYVMNSDGSNLQRLINSGADAIYGGSAWSPNSSKIAFYSHPNSSSTWSIYVMNSDGSDLTRLTNEQYTRDYSPTWSPDGSKLAFQREYLSSAEIWLMNSDGSNAAQIDSINGSGPEWSPSGDKFIYYSDRDGNPEIYSMNADGTNEQRLTNNSYTDIWPAWSPDGSKIAFASIRSGITSIYVMNSDGSQQRKLVNGTRPDWSADGTRIAFVSFNDGNPEIAVVDINGTNEVVLTSLSGDAIHPDWSP